MNLAPRDRDGAERACDATHVPVPGTILSGVSRASLWSGTAASWVDLHPTGTSSSYAWAIHEGWQVGYAQFGTTDHASLWSGTAASWEDLSLLLVGSWGNSRAMTVSSDGTWLYVIDNAWGDRNLFCTCPSVEELGE